MTKKNVILILIIACFLSIMAISVWGKKPEVSSRIPVQSVEILDQNKIAIPLLENQKEYERRITIEHSTQQVSYNFYVQIGPSDATDTSLSYTIITNEENITLVELESDVAYIHAYQITFIEQEQTRITFKTNKKDTSKNIDLLFVFSGVVGGGDIEI